MESSIAEFLLREHACELLPNIISHASLLASRCAACVLAWLCPGFAAQICLAAMQSAPDA